MDSVALTTFLAVAELGSITSAARALGRTQSAISHRIATLESSIGAPLFDRSGRGLVVSDAGLALLPFARQMAAIVRDADRAARDVTESGGNALNIALVGTLASTSITKILIEFRDTYPSVDLRIRTARSAEISDLVRRGEVSFGLRYFLDLSGDLESQLIDHEQMVVVCSPNHPLAEKPVTNLAHLRGERWLTFPDHRSMAEPASGTIFSEFLQRGVAQIDAILIDSMTAQKRMAEAGFGIAMLQKSAIGEELSRGTLRTISVEGFAPLMPVASVFRVNGYRSGACRWILNRLAKTDWLHG